MMTPLTCRGCAVELRGRTTRIAKRWPEEFLKRIHAHDLDGWLGGVVCPTCKERFSNAVNGHGVARVTR